MTLSPTSTHLSLHQLLLVHLLDLGAVGQKVAQLHIALPQLLVPVDGTERLVWAESTSSLPSISLSLSHINVSSVLA